LSHNATIIVPYFGKLPDFIPYFLSSCGSNPEFRWIIFNDKEEFPDCPENVYFKHFTISQFEKLAAEKLGFKIILTDPYKLCDFKPAFGLIFQDFLENDSFWGYCDLDMVFGRINHFITDEYFESYDIMSFYQGFMSGPLSLFRNNDFIRNLFKSCTAYKRIFQDPEHTAFDENIFHHELAGISARKLIEMVAFAFKRPGLIFFPGEFRYQYQWYVKRIFAGKQLPIDMTDAVFTAHKNGTVKSVFRDFLLTDPYFTRVKRQNWKIQWDNGLLTCDNPNREILAFHFQDNKSRPEFQTGSSTKSFNRFSISTTGFSE